MSLFPILGESVPAQTQALPLYREIAADPETGLPIFRGGAPVVAEGREALRLWISTALRTPRCRYAGYSWEFGCELDGLIGRVCSAEVKTAEAPRMLREALLVNPYITDVSDIAITTQDDLMVISATVKTIYGEVQIHANAIL